MANDTNQNLPYATTAVAGDGVAPADGMDPWFHTQQNKQTFPEINFYETALQNVKAHRQAMLPKLVLGIALLGAMGYALYHYKDQVMNFVGLGDSQEVALFDVEEAGKKDAKPVPQAPVDEVAEPDDGSSDEDFGISKEFKLPNYTAIRNINDDEKMQYLEMLNHPYVYQRYKAIKELRALKLGGSEMLLTMGLEQAKFWTRMEAVFGLAEMGTDVKSEHVKKAIGDANPYLIRNYFKRFLKKSTEGERYVMALAMYFVSEDAQSVIGEGLAPFREQASASLDF